MNVYGCAATAVAVPLDEISRGRRGEGGGYPHIHLYCSNTGGDERRIYFATRGGWCILRLGSVEYQWEGCKFCASVSVCRCEYLQASATEHFGSRVLPS